jgi:hypothetical protein
MNLLTSPTVSLDSQFGVDEKGGGVNLNEKPSNNNGQQITNNK